jgi:hypothetical protein
MIQIVNPAHTNRVWPMAEPFIEEALVHSCGDYTVDQAKTLVAIGAWTLLVAVDDAGVNGAATVSFSNRPNDRVAFITAMGGQFVVNKNSVAELKQVLGNVGATCIEGAVRTSMARLLSQNGFTEKYKVVGVKI